MYVQPFKCVRGIADNRLCKLFKALVFGQHNRADACNDIERNDYVSGIFD